MSQPHSPIEPYRPPTRSGLGMGAGAALGGLVGLLGPVLFGLLGWAALSLSSSETGGTLVSLVLLAVVSIPVVLLIGGCVLMISDQLRGWGVACLTASGVWLISSAGVCTAFFWAPL